ncbi:hypothetical protein AAFC00_002397 [Neodothiora populina]|uniref:Uncharacterized protein n=1 Tax=Neodothiora populina TaxID=2781224 RepID=A0ABR3P6Z3_9PEZI
MVDAAAAAGVQRFILDDFGWGPDMHGLPEFSEVHAQRSAAWAHAKEKSEENHQFTFTGISSGNPIDWALKKFPLMGFGVATCSAIIYDDGTEQFTGTTLAGIGQAVVGVLNNPEHTANRFVKVRSIQTCQNELLNAFQIATGRRWTIQYSTTKNLLESGRDKLHHGDRGWVLELAVAQLFDAGKARCVVAPSREESDADLLGIVEETAQDVVSRILG